jgi:hypothetical protein
VIIQRRINGDVWVGVLPVEVVEKEVAEDEDEGKVEMLEMEWVSVCVCVCVLMDR